MCPSKPAADNTAGFLGHHWMSKHHWLLVGNSYRTWGFKKMTFQPQWQSWNDNCQFTNIHTHTHTEFSPLLCLDSSTKSCYPSHSSEAAQDLLSSRQWPGYPCQMNRQMKKSTVTIFYSTLSTLFKGLMVLMVQLSTAGFRKHSSDRRKLYFMD